MTATATCHRPPCEVTYDPALDHAGQPHPSGTPRLYCSVACRDLAELERKREGRRIATAARVHARRVAAARVAELAVLPGMPPNPLLEEATHD